MIPVILLPAVDANPISAVFAAPIKKCLSRFRHVLTFSALLMVLPAGCPTQEADRFQPSPPPVKPFENATVGPLKSLFLTSRIVSPNWR